MFSRVLVAIVLIALFVPVPYFAGQPANAPSAFAAMTSGIPNSIWYLLGLSIAFLIATWLIAASGAASSKKG